MNPELKKQIEGRQDANRQILRRISELVESNPDLRFHQILQAMGISNSKLVKVYKNDAPPIPNSYLLPLTEVMVCEDHFYEESVVTLRKMQQK